MMLRPSTAPLRVPLPSPPGSSLPILADPASDSLRAASPTVARLLSTVVTDPSFESTAASALVAEHVDFAARSRLDYAASLVTESVSVCPPSVGGECALSTDVLEDRQEEFQCFAAALPHLLSTLIAPEGDPDAPDIPTPRSYAKAIEGPYSSQWQSAMDAEMASWKSTGTYVDEVPLPGANIVSGMWIFRTFSPTPKMTTLGVLLHVAAQRDYELHSLDFSTAFLQGSLHEEIWLRRPPGFTGSFPPGTQWSLPRPVYGLRQAPREWHDTLRTTLAALGFAPSTTDPSLFLRTDTSLPPFYVDDLVFAAADTAGLAHVKSELQRHTCTDLGELHGYLGLQITRDRAQRTITLTQSHMVQQVLQRFEFTYSSPQATPLSARHSLSALPSDESVEPSGPYPELVGCLMYLMTCTRPDLAYPLSILARYVAPGRHRPEHMAAAKRVLRYLCSTSGLGLMLGGRHPVVLTGHADASWADDQAMQRSSQGYTFSLGSGSVSWRSTRSSSVLGSSCEAEIYAGAMAAQELRWLTYLLADLGEAPRSPPVLYVDNKAMLALCWEHRLEHRTKHIALRYFLARELQQRGQLRLAYVASEANTADIFTKALPPGDHQRFCTMLACFALLDWSCDLLFSPTLPMGVVTKFQDNPAWRGEGRAMFMGADGRLVGLKRVLLVPGLCANLLSTKALSEAGMKMEMMGTKVFKATLDGRVLWDLRGGKDMHRSMWEIPVLPWKEAAARLAAEAHHCFSRLDNAWRAEFGDDVKLPRWADLLKSRIAIFDLDFGAILFAMYALSVSAEGDCYLCVPPDPGIAAAALGVSESGTLPGTAPAAALHTFTLDSGASRCFFRDSTTLTPLPAPVLVRLADPSGGPVVARSSTVLPCAAVPSGSLVESVHTHYRAFSGICVCSGFRVRSGNRLLLVSPPVAPVSFVAPPSWSPLPASPSWHALLSSCLWPPQVSASPAALACPALTPLRQGAAARRSSLLVSPDDCSPADSPHGPPRAVRPEPSCPASAPTSCRGLGILQSFTIPDSPQQNGIAERRIGLVMEYAAHQLSLWPHVSLPETSPAPRWTGEVGHASVFQVWGSRAFVRDTSADKLSPPAIPCVFLGFVPDAPGWQFYHPTLRRVLSSQNVTFDESVPFYRLFPYRSAPPPPPPLFLAPGPPPVDPLPLQGPAPSCVSQVDPLPGPTPVQVAVDLGAARGATSGGAELGGAESEGTETRGAEPRGVETGGAEPGGVATRGAKPEGVEPGGAASEGAESGGAEPQGAASSGGSAGALPRLSPQQLREWFVRRTRLWSGGSGAGGAGIAGAGGLGVAAGAGVTGGTATTGPRGARTRGTGAAGTGGVEGAGAGDLTESGTTGAGGARAGGAGVVNPGAGGAGVGGPGVGSAGAGGAGAVDPGGTVRPRPYFVPLLQHVLGTLPSTALTPPLLCPPPDQSQPPLQPASPLPAPSPYTEQSGGLTECREPASYHVSPVRTAHRVPRSRPPPVPGTHAMTLRPSSVPL
ncbi:unnamed protein product [Closterium sp. NIES-53]